jgi:hypothetical protein
MKDESIAAIREVVQTWRNRKHYTYHQKEVVVSIKSPISPGESVLRFKSSLHSFYCGGKLVPVELVSKTFHTTTLSDLPISENPKADAYRLKVFLERFDGEFDDLVDEKMSECPDLLTSSDPLFL